MTFICPKCRSRFAEQIERCPHDRRRVVEDLAGHNIAGRYTIKELLGVGGMDSSVWMAVQAPIHRPVAIKLLPPAEGESAERFARGARIASNLNHPNITVVHDYGRTGDGRLYLVMELLEGRTLHDVLRAGALGVDRALQITDQILKALDHAHKKKVVHRDIKPGNLFLTKNADDSDTDFVKVLDFGIARFIDPNDSFSEEPGQEITTTRQICGTPQYMAPEQIALGNIDGRTDLYALGVVLYRMLTGSLPFTSKDHRELFRAHLSQLPPSFAQARAGIDSPDLEALVMRVLAKSPDDRFASPAEMRRALRQLRFRRGAYDDELTPISGAVSAPNSLNTLGPIPGISAIESQNMTVSVESPRRQIWGPLLVVLIVLIGLGLFVWQMQEPADLVDPTAASTPSQALVAGAQTVPAPTTPSAAPESAADAGMPVDATTAKPDAGTVTDAAATAPVSQAAWTTDVKVTSAPSRATVKQGDTVLGQTPLSVALPAGTHRLRLARRGAVATLRITIREGDTPETYHAVLRRRGSRPATVEARRPKAPQTDAPAAIASEAPKKATVRMKLLDESEARDFKVTADKAKPAAPATRKPTINLLDP